MPSKKATAARKKLGSAESRIIRKRLLSKNRTQGGLKLFKAKVLFSVFHSGIQLINQVSQAREEFFYI